MQKSFFFFILNPEDVLDHDDSINIEYFSDKLTEIIKTSVTIYRLSIYQLFPGFAIKMIIGHHFLNPV